MLLAVEGGGFFSSSASGYTDGLALLLLGRKNEEKTKILPWNQYRLVEKETEREYQLASRKNQNPCRCASFICFGCTPAELNASSPKAGSIKPSDSSSADTSKVLIHNAISRNERKGCLKNSLKRLSLDYSTGVSEGEDARESVEGENSIACCIERRKVQWTDTCGKELAEIREFEVRYGLSSML